MFTVKCFFEAPMDLPATGSNLIDITQGMKVVETRFVIHAMLNVQGVQGQYQA
jgi:hypothetical protein